MGGPPSSKERMFMTCLFQCSRALNVSRKVGKTVPTLTNMSVKNEGYLKGWVL
jgi:hypothetical protein